MEETPVVLIVATPGDLQAGLQFLLTRLGDAELLVTADEQSALGAARRHRPALVILDGDTLRANQAGLIQQIKNLCPDTRLLVLIDQTTDREEALAWGADRTVVKGYPARHLSKLLKELLAEAGEKITGES